MNLREKICAVDICSPLSHKNDKQMKKSIMLFTAVIVMAVVVLEKTSGKAVESKLLLDNVEALAAGEFEPGVCLGSGNVTCSTGEKVKYVIRPFSLD